MKIKRFNEDLEPENETVEVLLSKDEIMECIIDKDFKTIPELLHHITIEESDELNAIFKEGVLSMDHEYVPEDYSGLRIIDASEHEGMIYFILGSLFPQYDKGFGPEDTGTTPSSVVEKLNENHRSNPKPIDAEERPSRMKRPPMGGPGSNPGRMFPDLYIQDELCDMMIDKYGTVRGTKGWEGLIDAGTGAYFQSGGNLAAEKMGLIRELGLPSNGDYWQYSYYEMWKEWMDKNGFKWRHLIKNSVPPAPTTNVTPQAPVALTQQPKSVPTNHQVAKHVQAAVINSSKAKAAVEHLLKNSDETSAIQKADIMMRVLTKEQCKERGDAARALGYNKLAQVFYSK